MLRTGDDMFHSETVAGAGNRAKADTNGEPSGNGLEGDDILADGLPDENPSLIAKRPNALKRQMSEQTRVNGRPYPKLRRQPSAFSNPFPPNLPLSIIRLIESYVNQFVASESWTAAQGEKGYLLVSVKIHRSCLTLLMSHFTCRREHLRRS